MLFNTRELLFLFIKRYAKGSRYFHIFSIVEKYISID